MLKYKRKGAMETMTEQDRKAGENVGQLLTEFVWNGMPPHYKKEGGVLIQPLEREPDWPSGAELARSVAAEVRATGSGFGMALADWLEKWARAEDPGGLKEGAIR